MQHQGLLNHLAGVIKGHGLLLLQIGPGQLPAGQLAGPACQDRIAGKHALLRCEEHADVHANDV